MVSPAKEAVNEVRIGWISVVRPSRQPLRGLLRMRNFLNAINRIPHAEEHPKSLPQARTGARLEARTSVMQPFA
jgi:hypothetical protein